MIEKPAMTPFAYMLQMVALFLCFAVPPSALAQGLTPLSIGDAIQLAIKSNRQLQALRQGTEATASGVAQARAEFYPRLDIIEGFNYSDKPTLVFSNLLDQASFRQSNFAIGALNEPTPLTNLTSQIRVEQPLYSGGRLLANLGQAKASAQASREITKRSEQEVVLGAIEAYYRVLLAGGNLRVVQKALKSAHAQLERAKDLYDRGLVVRADYLRTQVLLGSLEREMIEAENSLTIAHSHLRHVLGADEEGFELTDPVGEDSASLDPLTVLKQRAREMRPDLKAAVQEVERSQQSIRVARAAYYPSVALVTQYESNTQKFSSSAENFAVFVSARWNLFSGFATQAKVTAEEALHKRAQLLHEDRLHAAALEVENTYLGLHASRRQVAVARENVAQAQEALRITADRYTAGLARNVDVLDGETALKRAEQDLLLAQVNSQVFRARLGLATGERP